jgi:K+-sensing histidine kinase KdpD
MVAVSRDGLNAGDGSRLKKRSRLPVLEGAHVPRAAWARYVLAVAFVALITLVVGLAPTGVTLSHRSPVYLVAVLGAGALLGRGPAILSAVLSFMAFDYFYVDPVHTLLVGDAEEWQALLLFLIAAVVTGQLTAQLRDRAEAAQSREREALAYYEVRERLQEERVQGEILRRTDELRAALLSAVSHDFRTPLAAIKAAAGSLTQPEVEWDGEDRSASARQIEREADRLNRLVENLLDLSRIESGALKVNHQWYPLRELVQDTVGRLSVPLAGHAVEVDVPEALPPVPLDYVLVQQVLTNLLENAAKYAPAGTTIRVGAALTSADTHVAVWVRDEGPGLSPEEADKVFAPFYRVTRGTDGRAVGPASETSSGAGYGLAVCAGFVAAHGGSIWVEREKGDRGGGGASFVFTLPMVRRTA